MSIKAHIAEVSLRKKAAADWAAKFSDHTGGMLTGKLRRALGVIVLTEHVRDYLAEFDPMALKQAQEALSDKSYVDFLTS